MSSSRVTRSAFYGLAFLAMLALYIYLLIHFDRTIFSPRPGRVVDSADGFESTITNFIYGFGDSPLWLYARYYIVLPILALEDHALSPVFEGLYLLIYSLPVVLWTPPGRKNNPAQLMLMVIPVFISFRLAICMYAMTYFLIFILDRRARPLILLWYSSTVFLSSSTMYIFLLYFPFFVWRRIRASHILIKTTFVILYLLVITQFLDKSAALLDRSLSGEVLSTAAAAGLDYSGSVTGFFLAMLTGNPFFTAMVSGQYDRLFVLVPSLVFAVALLVILWRRKHRHVVGFLFILLTSMLSEGIGSYSVAVVIYMIVIHYRDLLLARPARRVLLAPGVSRPSRPRQPLYPRELL